VERNEEKRREEKRRNLIPIWLLQKVQVVHHAGKSDRRAGEDNTSGREIFVRAA
jgi:hypothetical protein